MKRCACCGTTYDAKAWAALPPVTNANSDDGKVDYGPYGLEFKRCHCGTTLAVFTHGEEEGR